MNENRVEAFQKLSEMIQNIEVAMMTTRDSDGCLRSRPMMVQQMDADGTLWFFSGKDSGKMHSIEDEPHINLAYASPSDSRYVSVAGFAEKVEDPIRKKDMWKPIHLAWFPEGVEDPNLTLIKVRIDAAEYWDVKASKLVSLFAAAKAAVTGKPMEKDQDTHAKIELH